jgi:hypothetical protein
MYGKRTAVSRLEQQQLVYAAVIADMVGAEAAVQQATHALQRAAQAQQGLSAAALGALAGLPALPTCLLQLLPGMLLPHPAAVAAQPGSYKPLQQQTLVAGCSGCCSLPLVTWRQCGQTHS